MQGNIEKLSVKQLDSYAADMWLLAPPCQPYTRRGLQKDAEDWRASSFMKLLHKLPQMQVRHPACLFTVEHCLSKQLEHDYVLEQDSGDLPAAWSCFRFAADAGQTSNVLKS